MAEATQRRFLSSQAATHLAGSMADALKSAPASWEFPPVSAPLSALLELDELESGLPGKELDEFPIGNER